MALQLPFNSPIGITANFWQIKEIRLGFQSLQAVVVVNLFVSQATANDQPIASKEYTFDITNFNWNKPIQNDLTDLFYPLLLQLPDFSQAQAVPNVQPIIAPPALPET